MRILELHVKNFRLLKDFHLDISKHASSLIFINGSNGHGKTSLLTSLRWCFFDEKINQTDFSNASLLEIAEGKTLEIEVIVKLSIGEEGDYAVVRRTQPVSPNESSRPRFDGPQTLTITESYGDSRKPSLVVPDPDAWLRDHLPERFKSFFLFDGEQMYKFFDVSVKGAIEKAVREIAKIDLFEDVVKAVEAQRDRLNKTLGKLSGSNAERLSAELEEARRAHAQLEENLRTIQIVVEAEKAKKQSIASELKGYENTAKFLEDNKRLRAAIESESAREADLMARITKGLFEVGLLSLLVARTKYPLQKHIAMAEEAGRYPADFQPKALQLLLNDRKCICTRHLDSDSAEYRAVERIIETSVNAGELGIELQKMDKGFAAAEALATATRKSINQAKKDLQETRKTLKALSLEQEQLAPKLDGVKGNETHLQELAKDLKSTDTAYIHALQQWEVKKLELVKSSERLREAQKKFDKATTNSAEAQGLKVKIQFLDRAVLQAKEFSAGVLEGVRQKLESFVSERYSRVKEGNFQTQITEDFEVRTLNADGSLAKLSEGEKMLKAYIFSIALREVVGLKFPLIVDTPFGRLDEGNREIVAATLRELLGEAGDHQAVFMMHDGEYTPYTRKHFEDSSPFESYLAWSEAKGESSLATGIDPEWLERTAWADWARGAVK